MGRAPCCDKANVKRGPWSPEEDHKLKSYIDKHGTGGNWIALPQKIGLKRCGKSCRLRWLNYLRPNIKHGGFTPDEDDLICTLYITIGSRWSIIAAQLPGRTDNDIKNYWNTRLKKKLLGKQRREQRDQMKKLGVSTNYSIINNSNCFSSLYPRPPLQVVAAPPLLEVAAGDYSALIMPTSTTLDHATFPYEPINIGGIYDNYSTYFSTSSDFNVQPNDFQSFNGIVSEDFPFYSTPRPRKLEGADSLSAVELVNSGNASSISSEIISGTVSSWGDNNNNNNIGCCLVNDNNNPFSQSYYYQVSQRRLPENNDVFLIN